MKIAISTDSSADLPIEIINEYNIHVTPLTILMGDETFLDGEKPIEHIFNFVNKTTVPELATVLKSAKALITVDTGTMHLGYAVSTPLVVAFYESNMSGCWAPDTNLYKAILLENDNSADNIYDSLIKITSI